MSAPRAARALAAVALLTLGASGCAGRGAYPARPAPGLLPGHSPLLSATLGQTDAWLRHYVMEGKPDSALLLLQPDSRVRPRDELLRQLQLGVVLHYAGSWEESNAAFEWAEREAEGRWTRSLARQAGSLLISDAVVDYVPPPGELAMIPYYRLLNYLALGRSDDALVEARKAGALMARLADGQAACVGDGFVHYLAGTAFRGAGERNDALVAYRNAERSFGECAGRDGARAPEWLGPDLYRAAVAAGVGEVAAAAAERYRLPAGGAAAESDDGELVVFVENGWVAHRASADLHVPIWPGQLDDLDSGDEGTVLDAATQVIGRLAGNAVEQAYWGSATDEHPAFQVSDAIDGAYILKLAWPVYRLEACEAPRVRVVVDGEPVESPAAQDLSAVMFRRWEAARAGALTRMVGRGIVKFLASRELERKAEKQGGEAAGWLVARLSNLAGNALERADTRSWSLLPDRISVARLRLPPGEHRVQLEVLGADGAVSETLDMGTVTLEPRGTLILNRRVWGSGMGDVRGLAAAVDAKGRTSSR
ncbi:MAG TPA: hypothetical protein VEW03_03755 [Longimicrobiaceae bacterium]|nr:hypothetical protein [Longimicrobiaceae bacterium]